MVNVRFNWDYFVYKASIFCMAYWLVHCLSVKRDLEISLKYSRYILVEAVIKYSFKYCRCILMEIVIKYPEIFCHSEKVLLSYMVLSKRRGPWHVLEVFKQYFGIILQDYVRLTGLSSVYLSDVTWKVYRLNITIVSSYISNRWNGWQNCHLAESWMDM